VNKDILYYLYLFVAVYSVREAITVLESD
jgi:hypothetical protein